MNTLESVGKLVERHSARQSQDRASSFPTQSVTQLITLRQIEVFRAVMQAKTVVAAASQLRVSQPTVTKTLARLEQILEIKLFDRAAGRVVPTIEAQRLLSEINAAYSYLETVLTSAARAAKSGSGLFRLGAQPSLARNLVPGALAQLAKDAPDLSVHLDVLPVTEVMGYLRDGPGECVVTIYPVVGAGMLSLELGAAKLMALVPSHFALASSRGPLTADHIAQFPVVTFEPHAIHGRIANEFFATAGTHPIRTHTVRFADAAVGMAEAGLGIAIVDEMSAMSADKARVAVKSLAFEGGFKIYLHRLVNCPHSRFLKMFEEAIRARLQQGGTLMP